MKKSKFLIESKSLDETNDLLDVENVLYPKYNPKTTNYLHSCSTVYHANPKS